MIAVIAGVARRNCCYGESAFAEGAMRGPSEVGGVGAAGESDDDRRELCEIAQELEFLLLRRERRRFVDTNVDDGAHEVRKV